MYDFKDLSGVDRQLTELAIQAQNYSSSDPSASLVKIRTFGELLAKCVGLKKKIERTDSETADEFLSRLAGAGLLPEVQASQFHQIRMLGNAAAHGDIVTRAQALLALKHAHELGRWFLASLGKKSRDTTQATSSGRTKTSAEELAEKIRRGEKIDPPAPKTEPPASKPLILLPLLKMGVGAIILIAIISALVSLGPSHSPDPTAASENSQAEVQKVAPALPMTATTSTPSTPQIDQSPSSDNSPVDNNAAQEGPLESAAPSSVQPARSTEQSYELNPSNTKDIWTTSVYSYAPGGGGPGGGLDNDQLRIGGWGDWYWSLMQFDLSKFPQQADRVILELYNEGTTAAPTPFNLYIIDQRWGWAKDDRLWWSDRPVQMHNALTVDAPSSNSWISIDITEIYRAWQSGRVPNFGIALIPQLNNNNFDQFRSSKYADPAYRPKLVITATQAPSSVSAETQDPPAGTGSGQSTTINSDGDWAALNHQ